MRVFYFLMLALLVSYVVMNIFLYGWLYASTKDVDLTFSLVNENVREDERLTKNQILLLDITNNMRYLIVIGFLFCGIVDIVDIVRDNLFLSGEATGFVRRKPTCIQCSFAKFS